MDKLMNDLQQWGFDYETTMERLMGDQESFVEFLQDFYQDENFSSLKESLDAKEYDDAFRFAHTLKGVAANLGLTTMYEVVCVMVDAFKANDHSDLDNQYQAIIEQQQILTNILKDNNLI